MKTYYKHDSIRSSRRGLGLRGFEARVEACTPYAEEFDCDGTQEWCVYHENGCCLSAFETEQEALEAAYSYLAANGWTTDRDLAMRRAEALAQARRDGLHYSGPNASSDHEIRRINAEIMAIT